MFLGAKVRSLACNRVAKWSLTPVPLSQGEGSKMLQGTKDGRELLIVLQWTKEIRQNEGVNSQNQ